jgi:hypothetical protein
MIKATFLGFEFKKFQQLKKTNNESAFNVHKLVKKGERSNTYLTHVCRLSHRTECLERTDKKLDLSVPLYGFHQLNF